MFPKMVLIKGAGDLATGVAHRLYQAGMKVALTEIEKPSPVRRTVSFAQAVFDGQTEVEGIKARRAENSEEALNILKKMEIPVIIDPDLSSLNSLQVDVLIEGTLSKKNTGIKINDAPVVIALGPGYFAGRDVHAVVETARGHYLGRVIYNGQAISNTGIPGEVKGFSAERVIRAPAEGIFNTKCKIGDMVAAGDIVAYVGDVTVKANISGVIRGLLHDGIEVHQGMKAGDVDPRGCREYCFTISDKARAIGGGVLEAILHLS